MHNAERGRNENRLGTLTVTPVTTIFRRTDYHRAGSLRFSPSIRIDRLSTLSTGCDRESAILFNDFIGNEITCAKFNQEFLKLTSPSECARSRDFFGVSMSRGDTLLTASLSGIPGIRGLVSMQFRFPFASCVLSKGKPSRCFASVAANFIRNRLTPVNDGISLLFDPGRR